MTDRSTCFVIMPFSSPSGSHYSERHFTEVYEDVFVPAIDGANLLPIRADTTLISRHILADLLSTIERASLILCDLSSASPNVLFELGWAFRADRPCVLVKDDLTQYPFDLQHTHVTTYHSSLRARLVRSDIASLRELIQNTMGDTSRRWSLVQSLGLDARLQHEAVHDKDPVAAAILDIRDELASLRSRFDRSLEPGLAGPGSTFPGGRVPSIREQEERDGLLALLEEERGDVGRAAQRLGITRQGLYKRIKALSISLDEVRK
jgi:hypothetical protein